MNQISQLGAMNSLVDPIRDLAADSLNSRRIAQADGRTSRHRSACQASAARHHISVWLNLNNSTVFRIIGLPLLAFFLVHGVLLLHRLRLVVELFIGRLLSHHRRHSHSGLFGISRLIVYLRRRFTGEGDQNRQCNGSRGSDRHLVSLNARHLTISLV